MLIRKEHAQILLQLLDEEARKIAPNIDEAKRYIFYELELQNLVEPDTPWHYNLTTVGRWMATILKEMTDAGQIESPEKWADDFRWLSSEVLVMIAASLRNDRKPGDFMPHLYKRGFIDKQTELLTDAAEDLYTIFRNAKPRLIVSSDLASYILGIPEGPAKKSFIATPERYEEILESMRLIAYSPPEPYIYNFTRLGKQLRKVLEYAVPASETIVSEDLMFSIERMINKGFEALTEDEAVQLAILNYINLDGDVLPAGRELYELYKIWKLKEGLELKTIDLDILDMEVLHTIDKLYEKYGQNKGYVVTIDEIIREIFHRPLKNYKHLLGFYGRRIYQDLGLKKKKEIEENAKKAQSALELFKQYYEQGGMWEKKITDIVQTALHTLEGFDLISVKTLEKENKVYYELTEYGRRIADDMRLRGIRQVPSSAVKTINIADREFDAPSLKWYEEALKLNFVSTQNVTKFGRLYADLAREIKQKPYLTRFGHDVLTVIPDKGFFVKDVYDKFDELWREEIQYALGKLEARGFIEILQNDAIFLTEKGKAIKRATAGVPKGIAYPITPTIVRILQALAEVGGSLLVKERKVRVEPREIKLAQKIAGMDEKTFEKELTVARNAGYIGKTSITEAGYLILNYMSEFENN